MLSPQQNNNNFSQIFSNDLSLSLERICSPNTNPSNGDLAKIMREQHKETCNNFRLIEKKVNELEEDINDLKIFKNQATEKIIEIDTNHAQIKTDLKKVADLEELTSAEVVNLKKEIDQLKKEINMPGMRKNTDQKDRFKDCFIVLKNFPNTDPVNTLIQWGFKAVIDKTSVRKLGKNNKNELTITCIGGGNKYKISTFIKSNMNLLKQNQISLNPNYLEWVMSEKVVKWEE